MFKRSPATLALGAALASCVLLASRPTAAHGDGNAAGRPASGKSGQTRAVVIVEHEDGKMDFTPATLRVKRGDTIRFEVTNLGKTRHEFRVDTVAGNAEHRAMMAEMPDMAHHEGNSIALAAGGTGHLAWTFTHAGTFQFACLLPGHYEAGMHGTVVVER